MTAPVAALGADPTVEQLRGLTEIGRAFTYAISLDEVAQVAVERGGAMFGASRSLLMLPDADGMLHVRAAHGILPELVARFQAPLADEVIARLQGLLAVPDDCFLAVPLVAGGAVTGLLAVALPHAATLADEWLLSALADQTAVALENARMGGEVRAELEDRLRVSQGATTAKDRALATLAHDIRSPLGAIEGYCAIMDDGLYGPVTPQQREALDRMRMSGRHLLSLLENVMDIARLGAGAPAVRTQPVDLAMVARDAIDIMRPASEAKLQTMALDVAGVTTASGDVGRVRQVLVNLVGNAVKFTPRGGAIQLSVGVAGHEGLQWAEVRVTDNGPGISAHDQAAVFEPYFRSEGTAAEPGLGLGLAISQGLAVQMGGSLQVESVVDRGATFSLRLPLAQPRHPDAAGA